MDKIESKILKILFVSHEYNIGGSTVSLISMIQGLKSNRQVQIQVLLPYKKRAQVKNVLKQRGIRYTECCYRRNFKKLKEKNKIKFLIYDVLNFFATIVVSYYVRLKKFDIICSNSTGVDIGARAAKLANIPHIFYVREFMEEDHGCEYRNRKRMKRLLEESNGVVFISKAIEEKYCKLYSLKNTAQFYNGFIVQDYYCGERKILSTKEIFFVQVGKFGDGKGTLNTIELLHQLNKNGINNWKMEFVGKGDQDYILKMQQCIGKYGLEKQVTIGEFCNDVHEKLMNKDVLIMNSRAEGFGRVTVEGMLAGCLVVGRNQGGTKEIILDEMNGITYENDEDFIFKIKKIVKDRDRYINLAKTGQQYALEQFDCSKTAQNFMEVVEQCLG